MCTGSILMFGTCKWSKPHFKVIYKYLIFDGLHGINPTTRLMCKCVILPVWFPFSNTKMFCTIKFKIGPFRLHTFQWAESRANNLITVRVLIFLMNYLCLYSGVDAVSKITVP